MSNQNPYEPLAVEVTEDTRYYWCACGQSAGQPFCDGSHEGTGKEPVQFTVEESGTVYLCTCRQTSNAPYCDGTHHKIWQVSLSNISSQEILHQS